MRALIWIAVAMISLGAVSDVAAQKFGDSKPQIEGKAKDGQRQGRAGGRKAMQGQRNSGQRDNTKTLDFIFNRFDTDKNGLLTRDEAPERMQLRFDMIDANGDESVSKAELKGAFEKMQGAGGRGQGKNGAGKGLGKGQAKNGEAKGKGRKGNNAGKGNRGGKNIDPAQLMQRMDKDQDGALSQDEVPERMKKNFDRIDADSSGTITVEELKTSFEKMKNGKGQIGRNKSANPNATKPVKPKRPSRVQDDA